MCSRGGKVWIIRRKLAGKTQIITLHSYPPTGLKDACRRAAEYPLNAHVNTATVADLATTYIDEIALKEFHRPELTQGYPDRAILPDIGQRKIQSRTVRPDRYYASRGARRADSLRSNLRKIFLHHQTPVIVPGDFCPVLTDNIQPDIGALS